MLSSLSSPAVWQAFQEYKLAGGHMNRQTAGELAELIAEGAYLPVVENILAGGTFPPPQKSEISKQHSEKKRWVYTYPKVENWVLKLLTWLLQQKYDPCFAKALYSFRPGKGVRDAVQSLIHTPGIRQMWSYKVDISNYFNSIPVQRLLPLLRRTLHDEPQTCAFVESLLCQPFVQVGDALVREEKGIMAGTPISAFLANLYLSDMDHYFVDAGVVYARYSDDIILFDRSQEALQGHVQDIRCFLLEAGLAINPSKEAYTAPGESWIFLGICYSDGIVDVAPASVEKLKAKMRRKTRALVRWQARKGATGLRAAGAFIRTFNRKLYDNPVEHELTWTRWYFPLINTTQSLKTIDAYSQNCIRYLATGTRTKAAYNFRYAQMKELGYISLVNSYYKQMDWEHPLP